MSPRAAASIAIKQALRCLISTAFSMIFYSIVVYAFGILFYAYQISKSAVRAGFNFQLARIYFEVDAETAGWASFSDMLPVAFILGAVSGIGLWIVDIRNNGETINGALIEIVEWLIRK